MFSKSFSFQNIKLFSSIRTKVNLTTFLTITRQSINQVIIKSKKYLNGTAFVVLCDGSMWMSNHLGYNLKEFVFSHRFGCV